MASAERAPAAQGHLADPSADARPPHHNRKKNHHRRGLQGRPLASGEKSHDAGAAKTGAGKSGAVQAGGDQAASGQHTRHGEPLQAENAAGAGLARLHQPAHEPAGRPDHRRHGSADSADPADGLYAALDLGTNNCRLLIAQPTRPGQFRVVDAFSRIVRLGEGLAATGRLSPDAMDRSVEALKICAAKLKARDIRRARLIATEACRSAENGEEFLQRVRVETGLDLEIINRETEARLAVSGCSSLVGRETRSVVLFDIGGGSSEIAIIRIGDNRSSRLANHITHWTSLPVGVVTLSERHGGRDVTPEGFDAMVDEVGRMLDHFDCPPVGSLSNGEPEAGFHLIGTSGTVTTLAGVHLDLPRYDRRRVDGLWLSDDEVSAMQARLRSWDFTARAANPCIGPDRADLVLAGCAILEAIRKRWPSERMRVADRGLREGLLTDMMADDGVWRRGRQRGRGQRMFGRTEGNRA
ncbi:Ppx/GppA phosphatase family protein [Pararhizobium sp.]|uniref:Ppx/GppA phosphatase family protein n=1 Tax=Pararhizobium sp. TaxID=1977563 RepID=UPI00271FCDE7|nr:Ppx/GppA phosphatase family protein [Pararhizobium sp.]MDO9415568.1 Ppx/GppA phosphatase family protein [Pararhizobium sp.]